MLFYSIMHAELLPFVNLSNIETLGNTFNKLNYLRESTKILILKQYQNNNAAQHF